MITLEQVEKLCKRANISYDEARAALEETNGDILEAIVNLERQGRIQAPSGGSYSTEDTRGNREDNWSNRESDGSYREDNYVNFKELAGRFINWIRKMVGKGNRNSLVVRKGKSKVMVIPVTILAILMIFMFWVTIPAMVLGLFFGFRYAFSGPDLGRDTVNRAMDSVADVADSIKREVKGGNIDDEDSHNRG